MVGPRTPGNRQKESELGTEPLSDPNEGAVTGGALKVTKEHRKQS